MADVGCGEAVQLLNVVFGTALILNDGHEIYARLSAGDHPADVLVELGKKFDGFKRARPEAVEQIVRNWPEHHMEAVGKMVQWALSKLDTDDRITIKWKGDADYPETVTRFEIRGNELEIEFAHPPVGAPQLQTA